MTPLNPALYRALQQFGQVRVTHPGVRMVASYRPTPEGRVRLEVLSAGESYRVSCPFCGDTRLRLYVNHRWGVRDPQTRTRNYWLAHCFNENCLADEANRLDLIRRTSGYQDEAGPGCVEARPARAEPPGRPIPLPEDFIALHELGRGHPARRYVRRRGFDPDALARDWGVGFSREAFGLSRAGRLVIPVYRVEQGEAVCWGWQSRAIDRAEEQRCKYLTAPSLKKSLLLYGLERVREGAGPVLVCEGATDVWRAGANAVALLGKDASAAQLRLLRRHLRGRPVLVALDADAAHEAEELVQALRRARARSLLLPDDAPVVRIGLPDGQDPGDCTRAELWALAERALRQHGAQAAKKQRGT